MFKLFMDFMFALGIFSILLIVGNAIIIAWLTLEEYVIRPWRSRRYLVKREKQLEKAQKEIDARSRAAAKRREAQRKADDEFFEMTRDLYVDFE